MAGISGRGDRAGTGGGTNRADHDARGDGRSGSTGGSSGRPGGVGNIGQTNRSSLARSYPGVAGNRGGSAGRPGGMGYVAPPETQKRMADYYAAAKEYKNRGLFGKVADFFAGPLYNENEPTYGNPDTFHGGQFHTSTNIPGTIGMLAGSPFPGGGLIGGQAGSLLSDVFGIGETYHRPSTEQQAMGYGMGGAGLQSGSGLGTPNQNMAGKGDQSGGQKLQQLASLNQNVSGNPGAPQGVGTPQAPAGPNPSPNYQQIMASLQQITPGYGVQLPGYQYRKATV